MVSHFSSNIHTKIGIPYIRVKAQDTYERLGGSIGNSLRPSQPPHGLKVLVFSIGGLKSFIFIGTDQNTLQNCFPLRKYWI
jgi:hypothetical protein